MRRGGVAHPSQRLRWEIEPAEPGTVHRLVHEGTGADTQLAATSHALLLKLDMWLAAGRLVPVDRER